MAKVPRTATNVIGRRVAAGGHVLLGLFAFLSVLMVGIASINLAIIIGSGVVWLARHL